MNLDKKLSSEICYFYFNVEDIPFKDAGIYFKGKYAYVRMLNPTAYLGFSGDVYLAGVYDFFSEQPILDVLEIKKHDFLFGEVPCLEPLFRGTNKAVFITSEPWENVDLPHFKNCGNNKMDNDIVRYYTDGFTTSTFIGDIIYKARETEFKNVKHLQNTIINSFPNLKLLIYIEFLKRQNTGLSDKELLDKWELLWNHSNDLRSRLPEKHIEILKKDFISNYHRLPYNQIPLHYRGKALNELEEGKSNKRYYLKE